MLYLKATNNKVSSNEGLAATEYYSFLIKINRAFLKKSYNPSPLKQTTHQSTYTRFNLIEYTKFTKSNNFAIFIQQHNLYNFNSNVYLNGLVNVAQQTLLTINLRNLKNLLNSSKIENPSDLKVYNQNNELFALTTVFRHYPLLINFFFSKFYPKALNNKIQIHNKEALLSNKWYSAKMTHKRKARLAKTQIDLRIKHKRRKKIAKRLRYRNLTRLLKLKKSFHLTFVRKLI